MRALVYHGPGQKAWEQVPKVLVSCITACGACRFWRLGRYGQCTGGGGWILGHLIDGTQAEYVRVPFADTSTYPLPAGHLDHNQIEMFNERFDPKPWPQQDRTSWLAITPRTFTGRRLKKAAEHEWALPSEAYL